MKKKIKSIFCLSDAGSTEVVLSFLSLKKNCSNYYFYLNGPAIKIIGKKFKNIKKIYKMHQLKKFDKIICSSGWSYFNLKIMNYAQINEKYLISILDEETYLAKRYYYKGNLIKPHEIWSRKCKKVKNFFKIRSNYKIKFIRENFRQNYFNQFLKKRKMNYLLVATSPKISFYNKLKIKFNKKKYISQNIFRDINKTLKKTKISKLILRLHPMDNIKKYKMFLKDLNVNFEISKNILIENDLKRCRYVLSYSNSVKKLAKYCGNELV